MAAKKRKSYRWKKFPKIGCRCVRSSDRMVKSSFCKRKKSPCARRRRTAAATAAAAAMLPGMTIPSGIPLVPHGYDPDIMMPEVEAPDIPVPGWAPISPQALSGFGYHRPRRRRSRR